VNDLDSYGHPGKGSVVCTGLEAGMEMRLAGNVVGHIFAFGILGSNVIRRSVINFIFLMWLSSLFVDRKYLVKLWIGHFVQYS
jgi:hypothetical protein